MPYVGLCVALQHHFVPAEYSQYSTVASTGRVGNCSSVLETLQKGRELQIHIEYTGVGSHLSVSQPVLMSDLHVQKYASMHSCRL